MQIDDHRQPTPPLTFGDLKPGDAFCFRDSAGCRVKSVDGEDRYSYVRLSDGARGWCADTVSVICLRARLVIEGEA